MGLLDKLRGPEGPPGPTGGFWSAQRIRARHNEANLFWIPGPDPKAHPEKYNLVDGRLKAASYNLTMGNQAYVTPVSDTDPKSVRSLEDGESFRIPAGQFAFLLTYEAVDVPKNAIALLALRARELKFQGIINVSGFHVDPGYRGRLVLAVYNAGPREVHLSQGDVLFEIFFADLDQETERPYELSSDNSPLFRIEPRLISAIAGEFETLQGLKSKIDDVEDELEERIHSLEREQSLTRWASALILGGLIAFGVRECAVEKASAMQAPLESVAHD